MKRKSFTGHLIKYGGLLVTDILACLFWNEINVYGNDLIGSVIDELFMGNSIEYSSFLLFFLLLVAAGTVCALIRRSSSDAYGNLVCKAYRDELSDKLYNMEYAWFDRHNSASVLNKVIGDLGEVASMMENAFPDTIDCVLALFIYSAYIIRLNLSLFIVMAVSYPLIFFTAGRFAGRLKALARGHREKVDDMAEITQDAISGILTVRSFGLEKLFLGRMRSAAKALVENERKRVQLTNTTMVLQKTLQWLPNIICAGYALYLVYMNEISIGRLVAFILILTRFVSAFVGTPFCIVDMQNGLASVQRIEEILSADIEKSGALKELPVSDYAIRFTDVRFCYEKGQEVLSGVSFDVKKGEHIAIIGESGGGKSTIFHLLCGFYAPQSGAIEIFGRNLREWDIEAAREQVALVSQDIYLFPVSIRENVALGIGRHPWRRLSKRAGMQRYMIL